MTTAQRLRDAVRDWVLASLAEKTVGDLFFRDGPPTEETKVSLASFSARLGRLSAPALKAATNSNIVRYDASMGDAPFPLAFYKQHAEKKQKRLSALVISWLELNGPYAGNSVMLLDHVLAVATLLGEPVCVDQAHRPFFLLADRYYGFYIKRVTNTEKAEATRAQPPRYYFQFQMHNLPSEYAAAGSAEETRLREWFRATDAATKDSAGCLIWAPPIEWAVLLRGADVPALRRLNDVLVVPQPTVSPQRYRGRLHVEQHAAANGSRTSLAYLPYGETPRYTLAVTAVGPAEAADAFEREDLVVLLTYLTDLGRVMQRHVQVRADLVPSPASAAFALRRAPPAEWEPARPLSVKKKLGADQEAERDAVRAAGMFMPVFVPKGGDWFEWTPAPRKPATTLGVEPREARRTDAQWRAERVERVLETPWFTEREHQPLPAQEAPARHVLEAPEPPPVPPLSDAESDAGDVSEPEPPAPEESGVPDAAAADADESDVYDESSDADGSSVLDDLSDVSDYTDVVEKYERIRRPPPPRSAPAAASDNDSSLAVDESDEDEEDGVSKKRPRSASDDEAEKKKVARLHACAYCQGKALYTDRVFLFCGLACQQAYYYTGH